MMKLSGWWVVGVPLVAIVAIVAGIWHVLPELNMGHGGALLFAPALFLPLLLVNWIATVTGQRIKFHIEARLADARDGRRRAQRARYPG